MKVTRSLLDGIVLQQLKSYRRDEGMGEDSLSTRLDMVSYKKKVEE